MASNKTQKVSVLFCFMYMYLVITINITTALLVPGSWPNHKLVTASVDGRDEVNGVLNGSCVKLQFLGDEKGQQNTKSDRSGPE